MLMLSSIELLCFLLPLSFFSPASWPLHREIFNRDFSSHHPSGQEEEEEELLQGFQWFHGIFNVFVFVINIK